LLIKAILQKLRTISWKVFLSWRCKFCVYGIRSHSSHDVKNYDDVGYVVSKSWRGCCSIRWRDITMNYRYSNFLEQMMLVYTELTFVRQCCCWFVVVVVVFPPHEFVQCCAKLLQFISFIAIFFFVCDHLYQDQFPFLPRSRLQLFCNRCERTCYPFCKQRPALTFCNILQYTHLVVFKSSF
jgi:hypothetical protein